MREEIKQIKGAFCYQKLLDRIAEAACLMDRRGRICITNKHWQAQIKRLSSSKYHELWDIVKSEEKERIQQFWFDESPDKWQFRLSLLDAENNYQQYDLELERLSDGNSDREVSADAAREITWVGGDCQFWLAIATIVSDKISRSDEFRDIYYYQQQETKLRHQLEFAQRILEGNQDCIKLLDLEGRLIYMNDGGQKLMEIDDFEGSVKNAFWLEFWQDCDRQSAETAFNKALLGKTGRFDGYCPTAKGTPKWWEVMVTPIKETDNSIVEILSVSRDITDRKLMEKALTERNQELDRFSYIVSHDLKAPLRGINLLAEWIGEDLQEKISEDTREQLSLIRQRISRMNSLIDGLLQYSRVGKQKLTTESVNLEDLLKEVVDSLMPPANFRVSNITKLPQLNARKLLLMQVFANLIGNAIKHHDRDRGEIQISATDRHTHYELAIADDGPGIPEADKERIFEIFQTTQNSLSTTNTGIGLAIIKKIVTGEGGEIWLENQTPRGCKFCFTWLKNTVF